MPYEYLDHQADVGLLARGATLEEALRDAVAGLLNLLADTETVEPRASVPVEASGSDPASLFVALLNAVLAEKDLRQMLFHSFELTDLGREGERWVARGALRGEPIDLSRHVVDTEVKAATYAGLVAEEGAGGWTLRCVLDL
ncbi:MAG: archease [Thermomicrobiaceae bacterium]|nr:archease [Thermomicrobiaceae bacterium]